ncbi:hypothetical protein KAJ87_01715 [Candidatus Pacearchaeota archaeon]|nr:hypothetical protein [Candidatus Pacearchaeota archaeon]
MFKKNTCGKCGKKISDSYEFCPHCGNSQGNNSENWGLLGKDDNNSKTDNFSGNIFGGMGGNFLGKMINNAMKMIEKEMQREMNQQKNMQPRTNMRLMINGKEINLNQNSNNKIKQIKLKEISQKDLPQNNLKNFSKLQREEPLTNIRRFSEKVIYEINIPGVNSLGDISITKLESSIEIKALAKTKAYSKIIPLTLPITDYNLSKGKLTLELGVK